MDVQIKQDVFNPLSLMTTPGEELVCIFETHHIYDYEQLLGVSSLRTKEKLSKKIILSAERILNMRGMLLPLLSEHNARYKEHKLKSRRSFSTSRRQFTKFKPILPLLKDEFNAGYDRLNDVLDYFDVDSAEDVFEQSEKQAALYRTQNGIDPDPINLYGWLRRGELDFQRMDLCEYNETTLKEWIESKEWEKHLTDASYFKKLPNILSSFGVGLSLVPFLSKTVYGAIRWIDSHPLIEISDRNNDLASCWFTLFHEFGHAILHKDIEILEGNINEKTANSSRQEKDANKFANRYLFNGDNLRKTVFERLRSGEIMTANGLSAEFNVHPMFASYWLLRAQYQPTFQRKYTIDFADDFQ